MTRRTLWAAALALIAIAPLARAEQPAKEAPNLDGTWKVVSLMAEGTDAPEDAFKSWRWEIKGKKIVMSAAGEEPIEINATFDPSKMPATVDMVAVTGDSKGKTVKGIYEFKQERLRVCLGDLEAPNNDRPTEFEGGKRQGLITLERVKNP